MSRTGREWGLAFQELFSEWVVSDQGRKVFLFSAWWSALVTVLIVTSFVFPGAISGLNTAPFSVTSILIGIVGGVSGMVGSLAIFILLFGMVWHLVLIAQIGRLSKIAWGIVIFFTVPLGPALYFFMVYQRRVANVESIVEQH